MNQFKISTRLAGLLAALCLLVLLVGVVGAVWHGQFECRAQVGLR